MATDLSQIVKRTRGRLVPFMLLLYILAFLDRSNIGFAKQSYMLDTGLSEHAFALGAGIFFAAYAFLGVPANLLMRKIGARTWIGCTTIIWGIVSAGMAFADTEWKFLAIRTILGAAEAAWCLPVMAKARQAGVRCEIYPDSAKMKKQMAYANAKAVPFVAIAGENEMKEGKVTLKDMATGNQQLVTAEEMINIIKR